MMDLVELTAEEDRLLAIVSRINGTIEEVSQLLDDLGVFDAYRERHSSVPFSYSGIGSLSRAASQGYWSLTPTLSRTHFGFSIIW
jgi:hypothetical protein